MSNEKNQITAKQFFIFATATQIGIGVLTLPSAAVREVGHDAWISVMLTGLMATFFSVLILLFMNRYSDKSIYEINCYIYGRYLGFILNTLIFSYFFFASAIGLRLFVDVVTITVLRLTPSLILTLFVLIPSVYLVISGLKNICRFAYITIILNIFVVLFLFLVFRYMRFSFIEPIGISGLPAIVGGIRSNIFAFIGFELITFIYPYIKDKKNIMRNFIYANIYTSVFYVILTLATVSFFGEELVKDLIFPVFNLFRAYKAPVLERLDLFFIVLWFPAMASSFRNYLFSSYESFMRAFKKLNPKRTSAVFIAALVLLSRLPKDYVDVTQYSAYLELAAMAFIAYLMLSFILSFLFKTGVKQNVQKN